MTEIVTRTLPCDHVTPVRAYAALRAQSSGRSSFLFESALPGDRWGRHAIIGYRARSEAIYPSGYDPFEMLRSDLTELGDAAGMVESLARAMVGFIGYDALHRLHDVDPWPTEQYLCRIMRDATIVVFDSVAQTMAIAGASQGAVKRCAWELSHGPNLDGLDALDPDALPEQFEPVQSDEELAAKAARAGERLATGAVRDLVLARTFRAPLRGAEPFDAYRALRVLDPAAHLYFIDFAESMMAPALTLMGASAETMLRRGHDEGGDAPDEHPADALRGAFVDKAPTGTPQAHAARLIREIEGGPRDLYGGAIGYFGAGGAVELAAGRQTVLVRNGYFEVTAGVAVGESIDPDALVEAAQRAARPALAAIRAAQQAQRAREAAAERKAAAEKAAAEKAAAEKAAAENAAAENEAAEQAGAEGGAGAAEGAG